MKITETYQEYNEPTFIPYSDNSGVIVFKDGIVNVTVHSEPLGIKWTKFSTFVKGMYCTQYIEYYNNNSIDLSETIAAALRFFNDVKNRFKGDSKS